MSTKEKEIITYIAAFKEIPVTSVKKETPIKLNSLLFERFLAGMEKQAGIKLATSELKKAETVDDLLKLIIKAPSPSSIVKEDITAPKINYSARTTGISSGIDIEMVDSFRDTVEVQGDETFKRLFTPSEMAYCMLQEDPPQHFAARFCAKEALRKCGSTFIDVAYNQIEICNKESGDPYVRIQGEELKNVSISLSHTTEFAVASAILSFEPQLEIKEELQKNTQHNEEQELNETVTSKRKFGMNTMLLSTITILLIIEGAAIGLLWF